MELDLDGSRSTFFIGPKSGGLEIEFEGKEVTVITPQSPLGEQLIGKKAGQRWNGRVGGTTRKYQVIAVC